MKQFFSTLNFKKVTVMTTILLSSIGLNAQTNVYDDIIATSADHTALNAAITAAGLESALQDPNATLTVFAPTNDAFNDLAADLNLTIPQLLALPNLSDILLYHVLGVTANASGITNGDIVTPLNTANTIKLTKTSMGMVYANHALVEIPDLTADNGVVHSIDAVILENETVVDVAIDNGFSSLATAVITAELLPALTDPFAEFTVFAPNDAAFDDAVVALGLTDITALLVLPNLADILLYHVLGAEAQSSGINNGDIVTPLNAANTIKLTKTSMGMVYANQAQVVLADVPSENGVVHAIDGLILPNETVVDVAIDNGFSSLTTAVITAELLPALTDPFAEFTVFAPTNTAFDNLASDLGTDINGLLALPNLADILLYHVVGSEVLAAGLSNGPVTMLSGGMVTVDLSMGVMINTATVTMADVTADNGVVHVIDEVLIDASASIEDFDLSTIEVFPNPSSDFIVIKAEEGIFNQLSIYSVDGQLMMSKNINSNNTLVDIQNLASGQYIITLEGNGTAVSKNLLVNSNK